MFTVGATLLGFALAIKAVFVIAAVAKFIIGFWTGS